MVVAIFWRLILYCVLALLVLFLLGMTTVSLFTRNPRQRGHSAKCLPQ